MKYLRQMWKHFWCFHWWKIESKEFSHGWMWTTYCAKCNVLKTGAGGYGNREVGGMK